VDFRDQLFDNCPAGGLNVAQKKFWMGASSREARSRIIRACATEVSRPAAGMGASGAQNRAGPQALVRE